MTVVKVKQQGGTRSKGKSGILYAEYVKLSKAEIAKLKKQAETEYDLLFTQFQAAFPDHEIPRFLYKKTFTLLNFC